MHYVVAVETVCCYYRWWRCEPLIGYCMWRHWHTSRRRRRPLWRCRIYKLCKVRRWILYLLNSF